MTESLQYFRPGEEARMIARCQFGIGRDGRCGAILTYPIKGYPWRRNPCRMYEFSIKPEQAEELFSEVRELKEYFPDDCLSDDTLWSDHSESGSNAVTRDSDGVACHTIYICSESGYDPYYSMREDSSSLRSSKLFKIITDFITPYETLNIHPRQNKSVEATG